MPPIKGIGALASGLTSKPVDTVKSLLFDPECTPFVSKLLLAAELVLCILIVKMVPCEFIFWRFGCAPRLRTADGDARVPLANGPRRTPSNADCDWCYFFVALFIFFFFPPFSTTHYTICSMG